MQYPIRSLKILVVGLIVSVGPMNQAAHAAQVVSYSGTSTTCQYADAFRKLSAQRNKSQFDKSKASGQNGKTSTLVR